VTQSEFNKLLGALSSRLRIRSAAATVFWPAASLLALNAAAVLFAKLSGLQSANAIALAATAGTIGGCCAAFATIFASRPVSRLRAAAELDRLAGLKDRAASLVAVRSAVRGPAALRGALEAEAFAAMAGVEGEDVLSEAEPLPARSRWLGVLLAAVLAALLVPARKGSRVQSLADVLTDGSALVEAMNRVAGGEDDGSPAVETAKKALVLIRAPAPRDPQKLEERRVRLEELAGELRRRGRGDAAARLAAAFRELGGDAGEGYPYGEGPGGDRHRANSAHDRYPAAYSELLARYFAGG